MDGLWPLGKCERANAMMQNLFYLVLGIALGAALDGEWFKKGDPRPLSSSGVVRKVVA